MCLKERETGKDKKRVDEDEGAASQTDAMKSEKDADREMTDGHFVSFFLFNLAYSVLIWILKSGLCIQFCKLLVPYIFILCYLLLAVFVCLSFSFFNIFRVRLCDLFRRFNDFNKRSFKSASM